MREAAIRVPSIGLTSEERRIVAEGYRLAEMMLADYRDPPAWPVAAAQAWLAGCRVALLGLSRALHRD